MIDKKKRGNLCAAAICLYTITATIFKLCGLTAWPWWLVLAPLWLPVAVFLVFVHFLLIRAVIQGVAEAIKKC